jgi:phytoene dehydrogenase-like protein
MAEHPDVVIVGAGLAGLAAAHDLCAAGLDVIVLEKSDRPGGRVATDVVDGFRLDRGFQVLNTSYPQVGRRLDLGALDVHGLTAGALIRSGGHLRRVANPLRAPRSAPATVLSGLLSPTQLVRLGLYSAQMAGPIGSVRRRRDRPAVEAFEQLGLGGAVTDRLLRPFLSGVLLESSLSTSSRYVDLVWRSFIRGRSVLPAAGMGEIGIQLCTQLPAGVVRLDTAVSSVRANGVDDLVARAVVVAADPVTAAGWLGRPMPKMHGVTTYYHSAPLAPLDEPTLVLDADGLGPVTNSVVLTAAVPSYAPVGQHLISSSVLDPGVSEADVLNHLRMLYGCSTSDWELIARVDVPQALPVFPAGSPITSMAKVNDLYIAGDHRATPSIQGALASGTRVAARVLSDLKR